MQYTLIDPKPLGDNDPKYGQTWWSNTHDSDKPVMFNLMAGSVGDGAKIEFEESVNKQSAKGTDYLRLRKVKVVSGGAATPSSSGLNDTQKTLELILDNTTKILALIDKDAPKTLKEAWDKTTEKDNVLEDIGEEPMDINSIPF